jgi:hypothetical protein
MEQDKVIKLTLTNVSAHKTYHYGTVNIVLHAQLELNSILNKVNAITAPKASLEITKLTHAPQDSDDQMIDL